MPDPAISSAPGDTQPTLPLPPPVDPVRDGPPLDPLSPQGRAMAAAIAYLAERAEEQPDLPAIAARCGLSPSHFQRQFTRWAGISPKRFCQILTAEAARDRLRAGDSVLDAALAAGLSGPGRLHDLLLAVEAMTPGAVKALGADLTIVWGVADSALGTLLIGTTDRGVCWLSFLTEGGVPAGREALQAEFPAARHVRDDAAVAPIAAAAVRLSEDGAGRPKLLMTGTNFQVQVWRALLAIPPGEIVSYGAIARAIGQPRASRAVGAAIGRNPISLLVPCHRVIQANGQVHNYRWGPVRKKVLLGWEAGNRLADPARAAMDAGPLAG